MRSGAGIYEHTDGRWEARYRKGRKPDGTIFYGSVYGKTYEEAEQKRAVLLQELALKAENGEPEAAAISAYNKNLRDFYAGVPKGKTSYPAPLTEAEVEELLLYSRSLSPGLRLAIGLALYMGVASETLAVLRWSDVDFEAGTLTASAIMVDAKHMFGTVVPCEKRTLPLSDKIGDLVDLPTRREQKAENYLLTESGERIKSLRSEKLLWSRVLSFGGDNDKITPEVLRATFICRCFQKGINFETVSGITGLTIPVLRSKYGHFSAANPSILRAVESAARLEDVTIRQMNLLILGAGRHGHAVYEIADRLGIFQKIAFLDDVVTGDKVIGKIADYLLYKEEYPLCFVAIGNNELRRELACQVTRAGFITPRLISFETSIARGTHIGRGTIVMPQATVNAGARIGDFCIIASNSLIGYNATVEDYVHCDCAAVVMKDCRVPALMTVESGEIVR